MSDTIWQFRTKHFRVVLDCDWERGPDLSWADQETLDNLESGLWGNYCFRVAVYGPQGELLGDSYLGNSIYADPADFRDHVGAQGNYGSYFVDMVSEAIAEARKAMLRDRPYIRQSAIA
jgi:hypothetical protein